MPCWECGKLLTVDQVISDRIIPGIRGGRYIRSNVRPQCALCSHKSGPREKAELAAEQSPYDDADLCKCCRAHWLATHAADCTYRLAGEV